MVKGFLSIGSDRSQLDFKFRYSLSIFYINHSRTSVTVMKPPP